MKKANLECPKCGYSWEYNYWQWVWKAPFHWLVIKKNPFCIRDYRNTNCPSCNKKSWIARNK